MQAGCQGGIFQESLRHLWGQSIEGGINLAKGCLKQQRPQEEPEDARTISTRCQEAIAVQCEWSAS